MDNTPLISVIIPAYNVEQYIDNCLQTVTNQTYKNLEIILVDDGSPDNSGKIIDEWAEKDKRIKVIHKKNAGLGFARNSGLEIATGDYIAFIDSDDYIDLTMYETLINKAIETNSDIVYCGFHKELSDGAFINVSDFNKETIFNKGEIIPLSQAFIKRSREISPDKLNMSVWHSIYKKDIIKTNFYSEREVGSEDLHFQISAVLHSEKITFIPDCLYYYRYNGNSLSKKVKFDIFARYKKLIENINNLYIKFGMHHIGDYLMLHITINYFRNKLLRNTPGEEIKQDISTICEDDIWNNIIINSDTISAQERFILHNIQHKQNKLLYIIFQTYYFFRKLKGGF